MEAKTFFLFFFLIFSVSFALDGLDLAVIEYPLELMQCLKKLEYDYIIVRCFKGSGVVDPNAEITIKNAWLANFTNVDAYIFPCFNCRKEKSATQQVNEAIDNLEQKSLKYGHLWFDVEGEYQETGTWSNDTKLNTAFFEELIKAAVNRQQKIGVYTSHRVWPVIMGEGYEGAKDFLLWYPHYDHKRTFDDFTPFGGWKYPNIKQYKGTTELCGVKEPDINYCPYFPE